MKTEASHRNLVYEIFKWCNIGKLVSFLNVTNFQFYDVF
jgi:hypothetical protein